MAYPSAIDSFTTKVDNTDTVLAAHVNDLQTSVVNIQTYLGTNASQTAPVAHTVLKSNTTGVSTWAQVDLTADVTGLLPTANLATVAIAQGGTGQTTAAAGFNALSPMTTLGDVIYGDASGAGTRLAGNITTTKKFLSQTGDGTNSAAPAWAALASTNIPTLDASKIGTGTLAMARGGTNADLSTIAKGGLIAGTGSGAVGILAAGTDNQVLTLDSAQTTGMKWATASAGPVTKMTIATDFAASGRFDTTNKAGTGSSSFSSGGLTIDSGATATSYQQVIFYLSGAPTTGNPYIGSPIFSVGVFCGQGANTGDAFFGIGQPTFAGAGWTASGRHIGFKIINGSLYATQADGTTETASAALTTVAALDVLDLICVVNGTSSVDYYWRKNGGSLSAATNLSTHQPTTGQAGSDATLTFGTSNHGAANGYTFTLFGAAYIR